MFLKFLSMFVMVLAIAGNCWFLGNFTWSSGKLMTSGFASKRWTATLATIEVSELEGKRVRGQMRAYFPKVIYVYTVNNQTYKSGRVEFSDSGYEFSDANALVAKFSTGSVVDAYYNEGDPTNSVLIPGVTSSAILSLASSLIWGVMVLAMLIALPVFWKKPAKEYKAWYAEVFGHSK